MKNETSDEMIQYATDVCRKYNQIRILAEEAEAAWRLNLEMIAESKYPAEKEMYEQQAEEELAKYTAARERMRAADKTALAHTDRSLDALWKLNQGISYQFETDNTEAYLEVTTDDIILIMAELIGGM